MLPRLLSAAAPPGSSSQENRRQCLKVSGAASIMILDLLTQVSFFHPCTLDGLLLGFNILLDFSV